MEEPIGENNKDNPFDTVFSSVLSFSLLKDYGAIRGSGKSSAQTLSPAMVHGRSDGYPFIQKILTRKYGALDF